MTLKLEGRVVGRWASEFDQAWRLLAASLGPKKLLVDLCGVTYMDLDGRQTLADIHKATGAGFVANTPMTKYFAAEAQRKRKDDTKEDE
ncbi:MAG: hypothetical protein WB987_16660 [Candidatus Acidiferrales bacterium]